MRSKPWTLSPDRCFGADPAQRAQARELYAAVKDLPLVSPHGHVPPALLADPDAWLGTPAELFIIPDHYVVRMLYSQGVALEDLGVPTRDGSPVETDHRRIWQRFGEHFHLFRGTPSGLWLHTELVDVFGVNERLDGDSAQRIYDHLEAQIAKPEFAPRALLNRFQIELLCTTDAATDTLDHHRQLHADGLSHIRPTFRPDAVMNLAHPTWHDQIAALGEVSGIDVVDYGSYIQALEQRRAVFKQLGALATDHAALTPHTERLSDQEAGRIFGRALRGQASNDDAARFTAHMFMEFARMSAEDGLVMQLHVGSFRNHNVPLWERFGPDMGGDIPVRTEWTRNLQPLLNAYGSDPRFRLIVFTLDESAYSRELAPLAGHYPALVLGPPWWFYDSVDGMRRYFDRVVETARSAPASAAPSRFLPDPQSHGVDGSRLRTCGRGSRLLLSSKERARAKRAAVRVVRCDNAPPSLLHIRKREHLWGCLRKKCIVGGNKCCRLLNGWLATRIKLLDRPIAAPGDVMEVAIVAEPDARAVGEPHRQLQRFIEAVDVGAE